MGHSSKKKKKRGGGGGGRRSQSKDHHSSASDNSDVVAEEITALRAIFQEDCQVVSEMPPQLSIKIRPYAKDTEFEDSDVSALLSVRYVEGYPYKCPKLQIVPDDGLAKTNADNLLSLLYDQANSNAREGRVMIYNLVEAAQEFLSEIIPQRLPQESVESHDPLKGQLSQKVVISSRGKICSFSGPFVYSHVDLFSGSGELWLWNMGMQENSELVSSEAFDGLKNQSVDLEKQQDKHMKLLALESGMPKFVQSELVGLGTLEEGIEDGSKSNESNSSESVGSGTIASAKDIFSEGNLTEEDHSYLDSDSALSTFEPVDLDQSTQTDERDLLLAHLLRLTCAPKGPLAHGLPEIASELLNLGIVSKGVRDLALKPSSSFDKTFDRVFRKYIGSSEISAFWKSAADYEDQSSSTPSSRYLNDFEELQTLGHGGFGHVVLCKNKLDGRQYAVKKIRLKDKSLPVNDRILREVATLSRLQHQHVVRYYQAWYETGVVSSIGNMMCGSKTGASSSFGYKDTVSSDQFGNENKSESTYLYIQMEYCPRTLKQMLESYSHLDKELAWHLFRQIVEGLAHIHSQGIIHRDLTPNNIFFDARNDIKIGDFGLAKFLKLEQLDQDVEAIDSVGVSLDGTGQVGTYLYTAPEIEQGWPKIDEKADMYSLGVVFFELWHPFETAMERHVVLSELKLKGKLPSDWITELPEQEGLLRRLMSSSPSDRPSATELLKNAFPPQMEYELLDNMLRTMQSSEDTIIYEKVVSAIFDDDMLRKKNIHESFGRLKSLPDNTSSIVYTDLDTAHRDLVVDITKEVCRKHCANHLEVIPMRILSDFPHVKRNTVKVLTDGGDIVEFCHELRFPFVKWVISKQKSFFRRYEISYVYRRSIGHSPPNRYLQGDFDIVGGETALTEAEVIKVTMDIVTRLFNSEACHIHLNHGDLLEAMWSWTGIKSENRQKVADLLSLLGSLHPQSSERKSKWVLIRRQLRQELGLADDALNRLQTVGLRFCGMADQVLPRLRGALPADKSTHKALHELSELFNYLRVWKIDRHVFLDALMPPTEFYHRNLYFQIYFRKDDNPASLMEGTLLAVGGRYDYWLHQISGSEYKWNPPGAVGTSIALETILLHTSVDSKFSRSDIGANILVCSRGGGGLLLERMELVAELWDENIKAEFVPLCDPSLTEQYEYASENDIKCLVVITDSGVSQKGSVKVRHLELKKEKEVERENLVKFLSEAMASQFRNPSIWN
ncbi:eIF-2-alpha kinase GCN2 [Andrographis paniculata]|uniref:eIF-2-alpha kinase GCN2 n=1 Tax=Andrographis paniculata TaxID=175694 RepID=UPI0021E949FB|nr:eIF-2-alpha kinase GCN2 [Andrographis paniculata]XP_051116781.1 eIF-2-alpha kinase GCN2 [Andrographis paniculata]